MLYSFGMILPVFTVFGNSDLMLSTAYEILGGRNMISKEKKTAIMEEYARTPGDTGSPEVQVAVLTARIQELTEHLKKTQRITILDVVC